MDVTAKQVTLIHRFRSTMRFRPRTVSISATILFVLACFSSDQIFSLETDKNEFGLGLPSEASSLDDEPASDYEIVDRLGGSSLAMARVGDLVYLGHGPEVLIIDLSAGIEKKGTIIGRF